MEKNRIINFLIMEQEKIEKIILSTFDSVNLINEYNLKTSLTDYETQRLERNVKHLRMMMNKDWFVNNITESQKQQIELLIK
jgi:hypothetical protein